jgi:putative endonuclease
MYSVYILRGRNGRHYIGQTSNLDARLNQHRTGHTYTTRRLGGEIELIASRSFSTRTEALKVERMLKSWKNPAKSVLFLQGPGS